LTQRATPVPENRAWVDLQLNDLITPKVYNGER